MSIVATLDNDAMQNILERADVPSGMVYNLRTTLNVALVCKDWRQLVHVAMFTDNPKWAQRAWLVAVRLVLCWQRSVQPAIACLYPRTRVSAVKNPWKPDDASFAHCFSWALGGFYETGTQRDSPIFNGSVAQFAERLFNWEVRPWRNVFGVHRPGETIARACCDPRLELVSRGAIRSFALGAEIEVLKALRVALTHAGDRAIGAQTPHYAVCLTANDLYRACWVVIEKREEMCMHVLPPYEADITDMAWRMPSCLYTVEPHQERLAPVESQLRVVSALARRAGITRFDAACAKLIWDLLVNRATMLMYKACVIAIAPIDPTKEELQQDDGSLESESESDSDSEAFTTDDDDAMDYDPYEEAGQDSEDICAAAGLRGETFRRWGTERWHQGNFGIAGAPTVEQTRYVITPTEECFNWACEHML